MYCAKTNNLLFENPDDQIIERDAGESIYLSFEGDNVTMVNDILFKLMHKSTSGNHRLVCRFGIHTSFLNAREA